MDQPAVEPPPASAARGGGRGTAELGAADGLGADDGAVPEAELFVLDVGVDAVDAPVDGVADVAEPAGAAGGWKSVHVSVRNVSPFAVRLSAVGVTVYFTPSLLTMKVSAEVCSAAAISFAPSLTRTPWYS